MRCPCRRLARCTTRRRARLAARGFVGGALALALCSVTAGIAQASQTARLSAGFKPEKLGAPTSLSIGFQIFASNGLPSPLTGVQLSYPRNLGLATSGLGIATCQPEQLEEKGPAGCPANSQMGSGSALARFRVGPELFDETASIGVVAGPSSDGYVHMLVSATGISPVGARIVMSSVLKPGLIALDVPLVPSLPEGEDVSVVAVRATLGGNLTYVERVHGRTIKYRPKGVLLPRTCPRGGFPFAATFTFLDGTEASAQDRVPCPHRR
jgi:hypothetical protein